jgi:hypothetical protein
MIVTTVVPEGIVMAADSAVSTWTLIDLKNFFLGNREEAVKNTLIKTVPLEKDNIVGHKFLTQSACKLRVMKGNNIAVSDGHQRTIKGKSSAPYLDNFCHNNYFSSPKDCALALLTYIKDLDPNIKAVYHVCGYNMTGKIPIPEFCYIETENNVVITTTEGQYGFNYCGANEYFTRYALLINEIITCYSLQDAIDVSLFAIDMSIKLERFINRECLISPPIDLLVIKPDGVKWVQQKTLNMGDYNGFTC